MEYFISLGILFSIYGILALSLNMVIGMGGLLSLAQMAFFGIGTYATALCLTQLNMNFFTTVIIGMAINGVLAFIVGKILAKFQGDYYAIVSAGLTIIVFSVLMNWQSVTNGPLGIYGISKPSLFGFQLTSNLIFFFLCAGVAAGVYAIFEIIDKSSFGRCMKAIREDESLAKVMGYKTEQFKSFIFTFSAMLSGIAGALFASYIGFVDPSTFQLKEGIFLFTIIILGGLSSGVGSIAGTLILISLPEVLRFIGLSSDNAAQIQQIIYGAALVLIMIIKPQGLFGKYKM